MEEPELVTITPRASERIRGAAAEAGADPAVLRLAARRAADGSVDFGLGFDEPRPGDARVESGGVVVVVAPQSRELLAGVVLDYVEVEPGDFRFVFAAPGAGGEGGAEG